MSDTQVPHRRMGEQKIQQWADSALLKLMQHIVTAVAVPLVAWGGSKVIDRLDSIDKALARNETSSATFELRLKQLEQAGEARDAQLKILTERSIVNDYELKRLNTQVDRGNHVNRP